MQRGKDKGKAADPVHRLNSFTMLPDLLSVNTTYSKLAAWATVAALLLVGAHAIKGFAVAFFMKLYEFFIQKNTLL